MDDTDSRSLPSPEEQLAAIRAMLSSGHRAIRLEPHTFWLWGIATTACILGERGVFTPSRFPIHWQLATFQVLFIASCVAFSVALDLWLTKRVRRRRDESYSFIQRQIGKCTLLLGGLGVAVVFAGWYRSWYTIVFVFWIVDIGLVLFIHGLFSEQFLGWAGLSLIALAISAVAMDIPFEGTRHLLLATCGLGLPSLGFLLRPLGRWGIAARLACLSGWVAAISITAYVAFRTL